MHQLYLALTKKLQNELYWNQIVMLQSEFSAILGKGRL